MRGARALFTTRIGGVSAPPFDGLNLARHVGDDEDAVRRNRLRAAALLGAPVLYADQVHGTEVAVIPEGPALAAILAAPPRTADAMVTRRADVGLAMMVADCVPVLLVDAEAGVIGAAHAGRRGLLDGVLPATVAAMAALGARPQNIRAEIGPSVCGACYEVPEQMREDASRILPEVRATTRAGTPSLDLRAGAAASLRAAGLADIGADHPCTLEDASFYSYRRAPRTGRFAGLIRREPTGT